MEEKVKKYRLYYSVWKNYTHKEDGTGPLLDKDFDAVDDDAARLYVKRFKEETGYLIRELVSIVNL